MSIVDDAIAQITALDTTAMAAARARQAQLTKPAGSLGRLEDLAVQIAGITGQAHPSIQQPVEEAPIVSRVFQKTGGLLLGYVLYGLTWSLFFSLVFFPLQGWLIRLGAWRGALLLAALAWWAIIVVPFIKYPANPPAVGDPETIGYRQSLYITMLLLSTGGTALVVGLSGRFAQQLRQPRWLLAGAGLLVVAALLIVLLPNNPDAVTAPMELINSFRTRSIIGLTLFWAIFGVTFGWLTQRAMQRAITRSVTAPG